MFFFRDIIIDDIKKSVSSISISKFKGLRSKKTLQTGIHKDAKAKILKRLKF